MILLINIKLTIRIFVVRSTLLYCSYKDKMDELMSKSKKEVKKVFSIRLSESQVEHLELKAKTEGRKFQLSTEIGNLVDEDMRLITELIEKEPEYEKALEFYQALKASGLKIVKIQGEEDEK